MSQPQAFTPHSHGVTDRDDIPYGISRFTPHSHGVTRNSGNACRSFLIHPTLAWSNHIEHLTYVRLILECIHPALAWSNLISIFFKNTFLKEGHSAEIVKVLNFKDLAIHPTPAWSNLNVRSGSNILPALTWSNISSIELMSQPQAFTPHSHGVTSIP